MRSSKHRPRFKSNRNRPTVNVVNRVFDSSGPEGKVRGTPQQIIDKYNQLARDAQLSHDRVATENFQQHAEHYTRLLAEAQREMEARREVREAQQPQDGGGQGGDGESKPHTAVADAPQPDGRFGEVIDPLARGQSGLVETPESSPRPKRR
ncbi:MAG: DUF4167 domain-containing protein [Rhodobacteraceae bacterium]|nr:DUF4167 domain-containing protein [Paracoccaceae bacterium]